MEISEVIPSISKKSPLFYRLGFGLVITTGILFLGTSAYFFYRTQTLSHELEKLKSNPTLVQKEDNARIIQLVKEKIRVPENEEPQVVTVYNVEQLKSQPFFQNAKEGDKVLVYNTAKKAILFDPVSNIIIEVAPIGQGSEPTNPTETKEVQNIRVLLLNGSNITGITKQVEDDLKVRAPYVQVVNRDLAQKIYPQTTVIPLTSPGKQMASELGKLFAARVTDTLEGELAPRDIDLIIIVGEDAKPTALPKPTAILTPLPTLMDP